MNPCQSPKCEIKRFPDVEIDESTIAGRFHYARRQANLYQHELAELMHVSHVVISNIERGKKTPDYDEIKMLAKVTGCTIAYLMGESK